MSQNASLQLRLLDLVRHQRIELHQADLITDGEHAELASVTGSVERLQSYDDLREQLAVARTALEQIAARGRSLGEIAKYALAKLDGKKVES